MRDVENDRCAHEPKAKKKKTNGQTPKNWPKCTLRMRVCSRRNDEHLNKVNTSDVHDATMIKCLNGRAIQYSSCWLWHGQLFGTKANLILFFSSLLLNKVNKFRLESFDCCDLAAVWLSLEISIWFCSAAISLFVLNIVLSADLIAIKVKMFV